MKTGDKFSYAVIHIGSHGYGIRMDSELEYKLGNVHPDHPHTFFCDDIQRFVDTTNYDEITIHNTKQGQHYYFYYRKNGRSDEIIFQLIREKIAELMVVLSDSYRTLYENSILMRDHLHTDSKDVNFFIENKHNCKPEL